MSGLVWIQTICDGYQQTTPVDLCRLLISFVNRLDPGPKPFDTLIVFIENKLNLKKISQQTTTYPAYLLQVIDDLSQSILVS